MPPFQGCDEGSETEEDSTLRSERIARDSSELLFFGLVTEAPAATLPVSEIAFELFNVRVEIGFNFEACFGVSVSWALETVGINVS